MHEIIIDKNVRQYKERPIIKIEPNTRVRYADERSLPVLIGFPGIPPQRDLYTYSPIAIKSSNQFLLPPYYMLFLEYPVHIKNIPGILRKASLYTSNPIYVSKGKDIYPIISRMVIGLMFELEDKDKDGKIVDGRGIKGNSNIEKVRRPSSIHIELPSTLNNLKNIFEQAYDTEDDLSDVRDFLNEWPPDIRRLTPKHIPAIIVLLAHSDIIRSIRILEKQQEFYETIRNLEDKLGEMGLTSIAIHLLDTSHLKSLTLDWDLEGRDIKAKMFVFNSTSVIGSNLNIPFENNFNVYIFIHSDNENYSEVFDLLTRILKSLPHELVVNGQADRSRAILTAENLINLLQSYVLRKRLYKEDEETKHEYHFDTSDVSVDFGDGGDAE